MNGGNVNKTKCKILSIAGLLKLKNCEDGRFYVMCILL
jgi:hypothetical protein